eukprot:COSAG02_NODE_55499_length_290_cov_0.811518_1_plen_33_part_10
MSKDRGVYRAYEYDSDSCVVLLSRFCVSERARL